MRGSPTEQRKATVVVRNDDVGGAKKSLASHIRFRAEFEWFFCFRKAAERRTDSHTSNNSNKSSKSSESLRW